MISPLGSGLMGRVLKLDMRVTVEGGVISQGDLVDFLKEQWNIAIQSGDLVVPA